MLLGLQVEDPVWKTVLTLKTDDEGCAMMDNIDEVTDKRLKALKEIEKDKLRVARAYNKMVKLKSFQVGDLVWKTIVSWDEKEQIWQIVAKLGGHRWFRSF